jgi:hypothetical protein
MPGGSTRDIPLACGLGDWDKPGGHAGEGGKGDIGFVHRGNR